MDKSKFQNKVDFIISTVLHSVAVLDCCIKVSKSRKQFMVSSILPKNERKKFDWKLGRFFSVFCSFFLENREHHKLGALQIKCYVMHFSWTNLCINLCIRKSSKTFATFDWFLWRWWWAGEIIKRYKSNRTIESKVRRGERLTFWCT